MDKKGGVMVIDSDGALIVVIKRKEQNEVEKWLMTVRHTHVSIYIRKL